MPQSITSGRRPRSPLPLTTRRAICFGRCHWVVRVHSMRGFSLILLLPIAALLGGCRSSTMSVDSLSPAAPDPAAIALAGGVEPIGGAPESFTIVFATFIPGNHVLGPWMHPQSYCGVVTPMRLAFAGDDRGFDVD